MNKIARLSELQKLVRAYNGDLKVHNYPSKIGFFQFKITIPKTSHADSFSNEAYRHLGFFYEGGDTPDTFERNGSEFIFAI